MLKKYVKNRDESVALKAMALAAFAPLLLNNSVQAEENNISSTGGLYTVTKGNSSDYTYTTTDGTTTSYWKVNINTDKMSASDRLTWQEVESSGTNTIKVTIPSNGATVDKYYQYTYTKPENYESVSTRVNNAITDSAVNNKLFENITERNNSGAAVYMKIFDDTNFDINSDFRGNTTKKDAGAIYMYNSKIGDIIGNYINNNARYDTGNGGAIEVTYRSSINNISSNFINNNASSNSMLTSTDTSYGGALDLNDNSTVSRIDSTFIGNHTDAEERAEGGAIHIDRTNVDVINSIFINNKVSSDDDYGYGGAISVTHNTVDRITGDFVNNSSESQSNSTSGGGGAIYTGGSQINIIEGSFLANNAIRGGGGAIQTNGGSVNSIIGDFIGNKAEYNGGAVFNRGTIHNLRGNFVENSAGSGGAIMTATNSTIDTISGNFIRNTARYGGAIYSFGYNSEINSIEANFIENSASNSYGGAIYNSARLETITANFIKNTAEMYGGAIYNYYTENAGARGRIVNLNANFTENSAKQGGGAIYNTEATIENINGEFKNNSTEKNGGAINNNTGIYGVAVINNITGDFIENTATNGSGGAIYNQSIIGDIAGDFIGNSATINGGAIDNSGNNAKIETIKGNFKNNSATNGNGGAIYNEKTISALEGNFTSNTAGSIGGAIYNVGGVNGVEQMLNALGYSTAEELAEGLGYHGTGTKSAIEQMFEDNNSTTLEEMANNRGYTGQSEMSALEQLYADKGVSTPEGLAETLGYQDVEEMSAIDAMLNDGEYSSVEEMAESYGYMSHGELTAVERMLMGGGESGSYSSAEEMAESYGYESVEAMLTDYGYSSLEEMAEEWGYSAVGEMTATEEMLYSYGYSSVEEMAEAWGYQDVEGMSAVEAMLANNEVSSIEDLAESMGYHDKDEMTAVEQLLADNDCSTAEELAQKLGYTDTEEKTAVEAMLADKGYTSIENMAESQGYTNSEDGEITFVGKSTLTDNKANGKLNDIYNDGKITLAENATVTSNSGIEGEKGVIYLEPNSTLNINHYLKGQEVNIDNATINVGAHKQADGQITYGSIDLRALNVTENGGMFNTVNNHISDHNFGAVTLNGNLDMAVDVNLAKEKMDSVRGKSYSGTGNINVVGMNLLSDTKKDKVDIYFANKVLKDHVTSDVKEVGKDTNSKYQTKAFAPIYQYDVKYENKDDAGYFVFKRSGGSGGDAPITPVPEMFNPAVYSSTVIAQAGGNTAMNQAMMFAFEHGDTFMNLSAMDRFAKANDNVYALSTDYNENLRYSDLSHENKSVWVKPYSVFEKIDLKHGPKVDTISYGTLIGFDSNIHKMKKGWYNVGTGYVGYNGSQIDYKGVDASMNGGLFGLTETFYKGNFWTALTATAGAGVADAHTMYGKDDMTMLMAGIGSKTGYNFEFADGKFIIQPRMFVSYSMVKTFDYTNAAGVRINSDPMHTIQLNPAIRFIGNTKNGWQPYASVGMVWNLLNETEATANGVKLPEMHTKPYVEYGVGLQKLWNDKYSAYGQAMVRNGGRTGIALTLGFRMALGKEGKPIEKVEKKPYKILRSAQNEDTERKVLKQLSPTQKAHLMKTTLTANKGTIK